MKIYAVNLWIPAFAGMTSASTRVVIHCKDKIEEAGEVSSQIKGSLAFSADAGNFKEVRSSVDKIANEWGGIDVLVNNAGITKEALLIKTLEKDFDEIVDTNLKGPLNFIRMVAPHMIKQKKGHIINISSIAGVKGSAGLSAYSASKAGLIGLTMSAARELNAYNIMVNVVLPGYMLTDMGMDASEKAKEKALEDSLLKSYSEPDDVAEFICFLTGTSGITGQVFNLDSRII
ncbi:MAG: SDR family NAD(P)-dependent oxidoreductase [Nitrospirae bacterium]|nr:SDR family NAD(P)-dependent oxidoreductase [Nitrospirota bacterium]